MLRNTTDVALPIWWSFVIAISQGITAAVKAGVGCPENLRERITVVDTTSITDPQLRQEFNKFYNQCFLPARNKLFKERQRLDQHEYDTRFAHYTEQYGESDLNWYGSHAFTRIDGFYDSYFAKQPIHGFSFDSERDWQ